jgi:two-component system sensor histidine kinase ChiS
MGTRVLVVDDHVETVRVISDVLTREGFSVVSARNGEECLRQVAAERPDLIILDVMMPVMDGLRALRALRENPETRTLPVIVLTVRDQQGDVLAGWMAGADLYINKPCRIDELVAAVRRMTMAGAHA